MSLKKSFFRRAINYLTINRSCAKLLPFYNEQTETERAAAFEGDLTFGTAGIRSTFGLGPARLNAFTVRKVALGLAQYLNEQVTPASAFKCLTANDNSGVDL